MLYFSPMRIQFTYVLQIVFFLNDFWGSNYTVEGILNNKADFDQAENDLYDIYDTLLEDEYDQKHMAIEYALFFNKVSMNRTKLLLQELHNSLSK